MTAGASERSLEQELRELRTINELISTLTSTLELGEILRIVLDRLKRLTQAEALSLMLYDAERDEPESLGDADATRKLLARAVTTVPSEAAFLLLLDPAGRELVFRASRAIQPGVVDGLRLPTDRGIAGWVARNRQAVRLDDVASDPRHFTGVGRQTGLVPRTMICVP